ncbi:LADA_0A05358g1_1 [Lachancea dasiensis]|uniref:LADA_0A05358g1_1 n=1 Tax=Lachancea dasiensis TaxID=1072105 RepID=A0A1G4INZ9_9SACH|nr:LADA_0A05358g1_1 [Lachancea dasiensis]
MIEKMPFAQSKASDIIESKGKRTIDQVEGTYSNERDANEPPAKLSIKKTEGSKGTLPSEASGNAIGTGSKEVCRLPQYNFLRFCYRHNPDMQQSPTNTARFKQDQQRRTNLHNKIDKLPPGDQRQVHDVLSNFLGCNDKMRKLVLEGILTNCCFPQLSFLASEIHSLIKIDFISTLPEEVSLKILGYLDCESLCNATQVCRRWKQLADDEKVWYHMCQQHIDRKCPNCGWGLPLLHMKRARYIDCEDTKTSSDNPSASVAPKNYKKTRPWKIIYRERFRVESNWRKGIARVHDFKGHMDGVLALQFNYRLLFTGSYDATVAIWDLVTGKLVRRLSGHRDGVKTLYFDDQKLITGSLDQTIRVWNYVTGACVSTYRGHSDSVLSIDSYRKIIVSGSADKTVKVWHVESRTCYTLRGHSEWVGCVKLHPKSFTCFSGSDDTTIRMWDIRSNTCIKVFRGHVGQVQKVIPLTISDLENLVVDPQSDVGHANAGNAPGEESEEQTGTAGTENSESTQFTPMDDSLPYPTHLLSCSLDNTIKLWDVRTGKCVRTHFGHLEGIWDIAADTFRIVSGAHDKTVKVWDLQSGKCIHTFETHQAPITCVGIGDSEFVSGDETGCVKLHRFD